MKIIRDTIPTMTIEAFADKHGLVMEVHERYRDIGANDRFYAHFTLAEVKDGYILTRTFGDGATEDEAIRDYARQIEFSTLVINATGEDRREIKVPRLVPSKTRGRK